MRAFEPLQSAGKAATGQPRPTLRIRDVVAITVGSVIGAGIFRPPSLVAGAAGSADMLLLAWAAGGLLSIIGADRQSDVSGQGVSVRVGHVGGRLLQKKQTTKHIKKRQSEQKK